MPPRNGMGMLLALTTVILAIVYKQWYSKPSASSEISDTKGAASDSATQYGGAWSWRRNREDEEIQKRYVQIRDYFDRLRKERERGSKLWSVSSQDKTKGLEVAIRWPDDASPTDGVSLPFLLTTGIVDAPPQKVFEFMHPNNWNYSQQLVDPFYESYHVVKRYSTSMQIGCRRTKRLLVYGKRDFLFASVDEKKKNRATGQVSYISGTFSLPEHELLPERDGYQRAWQDLVSFYEPMGEDQTKMIMVMRTDLRGNVPVWLFTQMAGKTGIIVLQKVKDCLEPKKKRR